MSSFNRPTRNAYTATPIVQQAPVWAPQAIIVAETKNWIAENQ
jgi:hypothetical protein